jgi:glycosyltransferase involved in cell wall biosynthesis
MIHSTQSAAQRTTEERLRATRRWSINGRFLTRNPTGVDRYVWEIAKAMDRLIGQSHPLANGLSLDILCSGQDMDFSPFVNLPLRSLPKAPGYVWEQVVLPRYLRGGLLSLCNIGPLAVRKQIVCIHDVNTRIVPESYSFPFRAAYRLLQPPLGRRAACIATVSDFSRDTIARFGIAPADNIAMIPDGHEHVLEWNADLSTLNTAELPRPFVLMVGSKAAHKNAAIIYSIAGDLRARGINVVVAGGEDANVYAGMGANGLPANVRHLGRVNDDDLAFLYRNALCLAFPSRSEGFGLPVLEAMALGCPVVSSDAASLPEVCGEAALYAPTNNASAWLEAISRIATKPGHRQLLVEAGRTRSQAFSWQAGAENYLKLMLALDRGTRGTGLPERTLNVVGFPGKV